MIKSGIADKKPTVGFFPLFYNLAETGRSVLIAKRYKKLGGEAIFFSHGGEYEYLAKDIGCEVVRVNPIYSKEYINLLWAYSQLETFKNPFSEKILTEHVEAEIVAYKKTGVKMIVSTNNFPCTISARAAELPLILVTPKYLPSFTIYPDDAEFFFTRLVPQWLKLKILNWYALKSKRYLRSFNKVAKKFNISAFKLLSELSTGEYTFYTEFKELLGLNNFDFPSNEYYIGPTLLDKLFSETLKKHDSSKKQYTLEKHVKKEGKSILFSLGSSGTKELFLKILCALNKTNYNIIAVYTSILKEDELPKVNNNILLEKFVPSMAKLNKIVDLAIIHGGQGTVYTAAYSGKPVIGFPMQMEQHLNLERLVQQGVAIILSGKYFNERYFLENINTIFEKYDTYLKNAERVSKKLPHPYEEEIAAEYLIEIAKKEKLC